MVSSLDGRITHGKNTNTASWASPEDQDFFMSMIEKHSLIVMGAKTFEAARTRIQLHPKKLRIVLTSTPKKYAKYHQDNILEFWNMTPKKLVETVETQGYKNMLLVGGPETLSRFLKAKLIDDMYLTIEPKIFGEGKMLVAQKHDVDCKLVSMKRLNEKGTVLLHYGLK